MTRKLLLPVIGVTALTLAWTLWPVPTARAELSRSFPLRTAGEVLRGTLEGTSVDAQGWIRPGARLQELPCPEEVLLLDLVESGGWTYLATGEAGRLYRWQRKGPPELVLDSPEELMIALLAEEDGVLVGTGPDGLIYRVSHNGQTRTLASTGTSMVTALARDHRGRLLAATAGPGRVFRVKETGELEELYHAGDDDVATMVVQGDRILIGLSGRGRLMEIRDGAARVLYETAQQEVAPVVPGRDGSVLFAAAPLEAGEGGEVPPEGGTAAPAIHAEFDPSSGVLYRLDPQGRVQALWVAPEPPIFALVEWEEDILVASGMAGRLHRVRPSGRATLLREPREAPISILRPRPQGGWLLGTSHPGALLQLGPEPEGRGLYESPVLDTGGSAVWGRLTWEIEPGSPKGAIRMETRSGATGDPEDGWSPWEPLEGRSAGAIPSPTGRYLQWRAWLEPGGGIRDVEAFYLTGNHPPRIGSVTVYQQSMGVFEERRNSGRVLSQTLPGGLRVEYHFPGEPGLSKGRWLRLKGMRTVGWTVEDPDQDPLEFDLYLRPLGGGWIELETGYRQDHYSFDTTPLADGLYELRLEASDQRGNSPERAGRDRWLSLPFAVDNTPPRLEEVRREKRGLQLHCRVKDEGSSLQAAAFSVDGEEWVVLLPEDRVMDGPEEVFRIDLGPDQIGGNSVVLRVADQAENVLAERIPLNP